MNKDIKISNSEFVLENYKKFVKELTKYQKSELIDHIFYKKIAEEIKNEELKSILIKISNEEFRHYEILKKITKIDIKLNFFDKVKIWFYDLLLHLFGVVFIVKLAEKNEIKGLSNYKNIKLNEKLKNVIEKIIREEEIHEKELLKLIKDERVKNLDSIILGINDALIELTGALVGMAGVINETLKVAFSGLIVGISASLSMAASSYFSKKAETGNTKKALKSGLYTGLTYIITVLILVFPFFVLNNGILASLWSVLNAIIVILLYNLYYSVVKDANFKKEFLIMTFVATTVSFLSFLLGRLVDHLFFS